MPNQIEAKVLKKFPLRNEEVTAWRIIDGQAVIVNLVENTFNMLNLVATRIWELSDGQTSVKEIIEQICQEFEVDQNTAESDCSKFLGEMRNKRLVILLSHPRKED